MKNKNRIFFSVISMIALIIIIGCNLNDTTEKVEEKLITLTIRINGPQDISIENATITSAKIDFKNASGDLVTSATIEALEFGVEKQITVTQALVDSIKSVSVVCSWIIGENEVDTTFTSDVSLSSGYHYIDVTINELYDVGVVVDTGDPYSRSIGDMTNRRTLSTNSFAISEF